VIYFKDNKTLLLIILFICSKEYEKRLLKEWENSDNYHLIEYEWAQKYLYWLWDTKDWNFFRYPVPNSKLLKNNILIPGLKKNKDYEIVSTKVYLLMKHIYGGGPDIPLWSLNNTPTNY